MGRVEKFSSHESTESLTVEPDQVGQILRFEIRAKQVTKLTFLSQNELGNYFQLCIYEIEEI